MKFADYLDLSKEVVPVIIYTMERWAVNNTECDAPLLMNSVVTRTVIYHGLYSTLFLCVNRGYNGPIISSSIMGMRLELLFLKLFVLFSLTRIGLPKKPGEKQRINKVHPYLFTPVKTRKSSSFAKRLRQKWE